METTLIETIDKELKKSNKISLVTVTSVEGITPSKVGMMMVVFDDGTSIGTVGGGNFELVVRNRSLKQLEVGESELFNYKSSTVNIDTFIKVFNPKEKLIIVGGGHVGYEVYKIAKTQDFHIAIFDTREEICNKERFPEADELYLGDTQKNLKDYHINERCYIVATGHNHEQDEVTIKSCIDRGAKYLGMLGSRRKIKTIKDNLMKEGLSKNSLENIYAPIGIKIGGDTAKEIALGIVAEIISVKNGVDTKKYTDGGE